MTRSWTVGTAGNGTAIGTSTRNVISNTDGATGAVSENSKAVFGALGQEANGFAPSQGRLRDAGRIVDKNERY